MEEARLKRKLIYKLVNLIGLLAFLVLAIRGLFKVVIS